MRAVIAPLAYGGSITLWAHMVQASHVITEKYDHYQKQTQRNRLYIHGANGKLMLSIPVKHLGREGHQNYNEVQIDNQFSWQAQHWKSLEAAYRSSPYYEFNHTFFKVLEKLVGLSFEHSFTKSYEKEVPCLDLRSLQDVKSNSVYADLVYTQVFEDKNGFIPNLSILDLLFNQGPECLSLLKNCRLPKKL